MSDQLSFADGFLHPGTGANARLDAIAARIDWSFLEAVVAPLGGGRMGRPPYDPVVMTRALLLAALYDLSDPALEAQLADRLSFRRFCGLALDAPTPDETTLCRFRALAAEHDLMARVLDAVTAQFETQGLILKKGTLMDATLVKAARNPPGKTAGMGADHPGEPGATWTKRNGRAFFGYKLHIGVDEGSGLVRRAVVTGAKTYESEVADRLISWDEGAVYGDRAYPKMSRRAALRAHGIKDRIAHRRHKTVASLTRRRRQWNRAVARRRAPVEAVFSAGKRLYGLGRAACHSLNRNAQRLIAFAIVYNLRRATIIAPT